MAQKIDAKVTSQFEAHPGEDQIVIVTIHNHAETGINAPGILFCFCFMHCLLVCLFFGDFILRFKKDYM